MTNTPEIHVNDEGTHLEVTIVDDDCVFIDISTATVKTIKIKPPKGSTQSHVAEFLTNGSEGIIFYETQPGDINIAGVWKIQASVTTPEGTWNTKIGSFEVKPNL